jgi:hypothetical protein
MRNANGLWNDGLNDNCQNNGQETWIYNQGVIASGLGALYKATGDQALLTEAEITLDAAIAHKTVNGILKESCDDVSPTGSQCNKDQVRPGLVVLSDCSSRTIANFQGHLDEASSILSR